MERYSVLIYLICGTEYHLLEQYLQFSLEMGKKEIEMIKKEIEGITNSDIQINQINK